MADDSESVEFFHQAGARAHWCARFDRVRARSVALTEPLSVEDQCVQSMPDASPTKWHLAHTSWFFEVVVLQVFQTGYVAFDGRYHYLFNSYYEALGPRHPRPQRGLLPRPSLTDVHAYRDHVNSAMRAFVTHSSAQTWAAAASLVELGLSHEEQHQELLLTDILHLMAGNPLLPAYAVQPKPAIGDGTGVLSSRWVPVAGGVYTIGHGGDGFAFDNETPRHQVLLQPFEIASHLVTCGEYLEFVRDGGYARPAHWLSDGWNAVTGLGLQAPLYWLAPGDPRAPSEQWQTFGLNGLQTIDTNAPVIHINFFEAAAYADWAGARLPTEFEWEVAFDSPHIAQMLGHAWQWTRSSYDPYPGFRPLNGAVREYNGKFMVGQQVLRGSSVATPPNHARKTYRNFFPPGARWQFTGIRLTKDM